MTRFERRFLARIARYGALVLGGLSWLVLAAWGARRIENLEIAEAIDLPARDLAFLLRFLEIALALSAVLGTGLAVTDLRRRGVLASFLAAGMKVRHVLRPVLLAAAVVLAASIGIHDCVHRLESRSSDGPRPAAWKHGDIWIWSPEGSTPDGDIAGAILFASRHLAVSRVERARWAPESGTFVATGATPLAAGGVSIRGFPRSPPLPDPFAPVSIPSLFRSPTPLRPILAALDRLVLAPFLVVVAAYAVLLGATRRPAGLALLIVGASVLVLLNVLAVKLLWTSPVAGLVAQVAWTVAATAVFAGSVTLFHRRGPGPDRTLG